MVTFGYDCLSVSGKVDLGGEKLVYFTGMYINESENVTDLSICQSVWLEQVVVLAINLSQIRALKKDLGARNSVFDYCIIKYNPMRSFEKQNEVNRPRFEATVTVSGRVPSAPKVRWLELVKGFCSPKTVHGMHNRGKKRCFRLFVQKLQFIADTMMQES